MRYGVCKRSHNKNLQVSGEFYWNNINWNILVHLNTDQKVQNCKANVTIRCAIKHNNSNNIYPILFFAESNRKVWTLVLTSSRWMQPNNEYVKCRRAESHEPWKRSSSTREKDSMKWTSTEARESPVFSRTEVQLSLITAWRQTTSPLSVTWLLNLIMTAPQGWVYPMATRPTSDRATGVRVR